MGPRRSILQGMDGFWVRQKGRQFWAGDLDAVIRMLADGRLEPQDEVYVGDQWQPIADYPPLQRGPTPDPFAAGSDAAGVDADSAYQSYVGQEPPRGLHSVPRPGVPQNASVTLVPVGARPTPTREPVRPPGPSASAAPEADADEETDPGIQQVTPPRGEVIDFPRPPLARPIPLPPPPRRETPRPPPMVRPGRVLAYILIGAAGVGGWLAWVRWAGTTDAGISTAPVARAPVVVTDSELDKVDRELRSLLAADPRPIKGEGALADALLVDLQHMRIDVATVDATVSEWTGRSNDQPVTATLRVVIASADDLDRTVAAIALVVGRYARGYHLTFDRVDIVLRTNDGERLRSLDPRRAEEYYMDRVSLEKMLEP